MGNCCGFREINPNPNATESLANRNDDPQKVIIENKKESGENQRANRQAIQKDSRASNLQQASRMDSKQRKAAKEQIDDKMLNLFGIPKDCNIKFENDEEALKAEEFLKEHMPDSFDEY